MLLFVPVIMLVAAYGIVQLLHWTKSGARWDWIISVFTIVSVWIFLVAVPLNSYKEVMIDSWIKGSTSSISLSFGMTELSWIVLVPLASYFSTLILVSVISSRQEQEKFLWHNTLLMYAAVYCALVSSDLVTIIIGLSLFDLAELTLSLLMNLKAEGQPTLDIKAYSWKLISIFIILGVIIASSTSADAALSMTISLFGAVALIVAFFIRMVQGRKIIDDSSTVTKSSFYQRVLFLSSSVATLAALSKITFINMENLFSRFLSIFLGVVILFILLKKSNQTFSLIASQIAGMIFFYGVALSVILGVNWVGGYWIASFVLFQAGFSLFSESQNKFVWISVIILILAVGIPFTPFLPMWEVLQGSGWVISLMVIGLIAVFFCLSIKLVFQETRNRISQAGGIRSIYVFSLIIFTVSQWVILKANSQVPIEQSKWWMGVVIVALGFGLFALWKSIIRRKNPQIISIESGMQKQINWGIEKSKRIDLMIRRGATKTFHFIESFVNLFTSIQESESGFYGLFSL